MWSVRVSRYRSPMDIINDDLLFHAAIRKAFQIWPTRRGLQRAVMVVGHTMFVIACTMLKTSRSYQDLGGNYLDQINKDQLTGYFLKQLQRLGLKVTIEPVTTLA